MSFPHIEGLEWDDENESHLAEHLEPDTVAAMIEGGDWAALPNKRPHPQQRRLVIGREPGGSIVSVVVEPAETSGYWRRLPLGGRREQRPVTSNEHGDTIMATDEPTEFQPMATDKEWSDQGWASEPEPMTAASRLGAVISVKFDPDTARMIRRVARLKGVTQAEFVRDAAQSAAQAATDADMDTTATRAGENR